MAKSTNYEPTLFDLAFVDAIEYLVKHKKEHKMFRTQKQLLEELQLNESTYVSIRNKLRGVPRHMITECTHILTSKYNVSSNYLTYRSGQIMSKPISQEGKQAMSYNEAITELNLLKVEVAGLKARLSDAQKIINSQIMLINKLSEPTKQKRPARN